MNYKIILFIILSFIVEIGKFQRMTPDEMEKVLDFFKHEDNEKTKKCLLALNGKWYPETMYYFLYCDATKFKMNTPPSSNCEGLDCWENQLTDASRLQIEDIMNRYRQKVAKGLCSKWCKKNKKKLVFELRWEYSLEFIAMEKIKLCQQKGSSSEKAKLKFIGDDREIEVLRDIATTSFQSITGLQNEMRLILWKLISENYLNDWDEKTWQFKRGYMVDVGCAYVVRREVNYLTALNENVEAGNVGHLVCVYQTPLNRAQAEDLDSTPENCIKNDLMKFVGEIKYYPPLCKPILFFNLTLDFLKASTYYCQRTPNYYTDPACYESNTYYSPKTWNERMYGFTVKYIDADLSFFEMECNVPIDLPQPAEEGSTLILNYNCTLKQEVIVEADLQTCTGWHCGDSQMTDFVKLDILNRLNEARQLIANGECSPECSPPCKYCTKIQYCDMTSLRWHWFLEWKASQKVKDCPSKNNFDQSLIFDDGPFPDPVFYEQITLHFDLPSPDGQLALGKTFSTLFWKNTFNDWTENNEFRRGNALWIGCSIVVRPKATATTVEPKLKLENGIATHMVCIYAALQKFATKRGNSTDGSCCQKCPKPISLLKPCNIESAKNIPPHPKLCTPVSLDITMSCQVNYCTGDSMSEAWLYQLDGTTILQNVDGSFKAIYRYGNVGSRTGAILGIFFILLLLLWCSIVALIRKFYMEDISLKKIKPETKLPTRKMKPIPVRRRAKLPQVEKLTPKPDTKKPRLPGVTTPRPVAVKTKKSLPTKTIKPSGVKTTKPSGIKTTIPSKVKPTKRSEVKTTRRSGIKTTQPLGVKTTISSTVETTKPSEVKTTKPSEVKPTQPWGVKPTIPSTVETTKPSEVKKTKPSELKTTTSSTVKTTKRPSATTATPTPSAVKTTKSSSVKRKVPTRRSRLSKNYNFNARR